MFKYERKEGAGTSIRYHIIIYVYRHLNILKNKGKKGGARPSDIRQLVSELRVGAGLLLSNCPPPPPPHRPHHSHQNRSHHRIVNVIIALLILIIVLLIIIAIVVIIIMVAIITRPRRSCSLGLKGGTDKQPPTAI